MDQFDKTDLNRLMSHPEGLCVSIYIPTIRKGHEVSQNQIRFKNALNQAEDIIQKTRGKDASRIGSVLDPAKKRLTDKRFWLKQEQGLAAFLSQHLFSFYRTPLNFEPLVIVNDRFHLKPLLPLFVTDAAFFLLAATQKAGAATRKPSRPTGGRKSARLSTGRRPARPAASKPTQGRGQGRSAKRAGQLDRSRSASRPAAGRGDGRRGRSRGGEASSFVPIHVLSDGPAAGMEIHLGGGRMICVRPGFDRQTLLDVLAALSAGPSAA